MLLWCCLAAEESSSEGWMVADRLHLAAADSNNSSSSSSNSSRAVEVVFGCENMETGEIYKQRVDGVLGMGNNANALPRQVGFECCLYSTAVLVGTS
jgi:hypothetical protein